MSENKFVNKYVVVRSNQDGVWMGKCTEYNEGPDRGFCTLEDAVLVHTWEKTAATAGLAVAGPGMGSHVTHPVPIHRCTDVVGISICTKAAEKATRNFEPRWDGTN